MAKARAEVDAGHCETVVCLVPNATDTNWWGVHAPAAAETKFLQGRVVFEGATGSPRFGGVVLVFRRSRMLFDLPAAEPPPKQRWRDPDYAGVAS